MKPTIIKTDGTCVLYRDIYKGLPFLLDNKGQSIKHVNDYLRFLACKKKLDISSVQQYSHTYRQFAEWLQINDDKEWKDVTESDLIDWRDEDKERIATINNYKNKEEKMLVHFTVNRKIDSLYSMFWWSQDNGYFKNILGEGLDSNGVIFQIPVEIKEKKKGIVAPIKFEQTHKKVVTIPTDDDVDDIYEALTLLREEGNHLLSEELIIRDALMVEWFCVVGNRGEELVSLTIDCLPNMKVVEKADGNKAMTEVYLTKGTKGGKPRNVMVTPDLILRTYDFIGNERQSLSKSNCTAKEVFLSVRGSKLQRKSISNLYKNIAERFPNIINKYVNPHSLRHYSLTVMAEVNINSSNAHGDKSALKGVALIVAQQGGHNDSNFTMNNYVHSAERKIAEKIANPDASLIDVQDKAYLRRQVKKLEKENAKLRNTSIQ